MNINTLTQSLKSIEEYEPSLLNQAKKLRRKLVFTKEKAQQEATDFVLKHKLKTLFIQIEYHFPKNEDDFLILLNKNGFKESDEGLSYKYQPNGKQMSPDFYIGVKKDNRWLIKFSIELKSSKQKTIMLNDGYFEPNTVYLVTCKSGDFIGVGKYMIKSDEKNIIQTLRKEKLVWNQKFKTVGSLHLYIRCANSYKFDQFIQKRNLHQRLFYNWLQHKLF